MKCFLLVIVFVLSFAGDGENMYQESPPSTPEHPSDARLVLKSLMDNNPCKDFNTFSRRLYKARAVGECVNAFKAMKLLKDELLIPECDDVDTIQCTESYLNWYCSGYITRKQPTTRGTEGGFCRIWWQGGSSTPKRERVWLTSCYDPKDYKRSQSEFQKSQSNFQRSQSDYQRSKSDYQRSQSRGSSGENGGLRLGPAMPSQRAPPRFKGHYLP
nr:PREDICTED: uncharacterized protein LOC109033362 [Bemisia tabaci]